LDRYWASKPLPTLTPRNINTESNLSNPEKADWINDDWSVYDRDKLPMTPGLKPIQYTGVNQNPVIQQKNNTTTNTQKTNNSIPLLRFAPILGSGLNYFKDLIGA
jgi:outer membrane receptor for Fe3+-dicitrate